METPQWHNPARPKTLAELLKADLRLNADKKMRNVQYEELRELREARDNIDFEIEDTEAVLEAADAFIRQKQVEKQVDVHALGLSDALIRLMPIFVRVCTRNGVVGASRSCVTTHIMVPTLDMTRSFAFLSNLRRSRSKRRWS